MTKPNVLIKNCQTGEEILREMTDEEYSELLANEKENADRLAALESDPAE
jgi:hypothetical protein